MKALVVLAALAGTAAAGEIDSFPMSNIEGMLPERPTEMRFVPGIGQLWRYGTMVVLFDGAWWETLAAIDARDAMGSKRAEVQDEHVRLDVIVRGTLIAFELTVTGRSRVCYREGKCDPWEPASVQMVCWRESNHHEPPRCAFE